MIVICEAQWVNGTEEWDSRSTYTLDIAGVRAEVHNKSDYWSWSVQRNSHTGWQFDVAHGTADDETTAKEAAEDAIRVFYATKEQAR